MNEPLPINITELIHPFVNTIPDIDELFVAKNKEGYIVNINSFTKRVDDLADKYQDTGANHDNGEKHDWAVFKGDALEVLVEYLIKTSGHDNRIGIYGYTPIEKSDDCGVDGIGIGENKNPATIQVKYRTGDYVLEMNKDHLGNFTNASWGKYNVFQTDTKNMLLVTTANDIHYTVQELCFFNKVRVLNRDNLREMLDNRPMFWQGFWESMKQSRVKPIDVTPKTLREHQQEAINAIYE